MATTTTEYPLNVFHGGGPLDDGLAWDTKTLCYGNHSRIPQHITEYRWTPEIIVGEKSGLRARVWQWLGGSRGHSE